MKATATIQAEQELEWLEGWLRFAAEPIGQECCGRGNGQECCGSPDPVYPDIDYVGWAMNGRAKELRAMLVQQPTTNQDEEVVEPSFRNTLDEIGAFVPESATHYNICLRENLQGRALLVITFFRMNSKRLCGWECYSSEDVERWEASDSVYRKGAFADRILPKLRSLGCSAKLQHDAAMTQQEVGNE